jgi:hypothetical protein
LLQRCVSLAQSFVDGNCVVCREHIHSQCLVCCQHCRRMLCAACALQHQHVHLAEWRCPAAMTPEVLVEYDNIFEALQERVLHPPACACGSVHPLRQYGSNTEEEEILLANALASMYVKVSQSPQIPPNNAFDALEDLELWYWRPDVQARPVLQCAGMDWEGYEQVRRMRLPAQNTLHIVIGRRVAGSVRAAALV